MIFITTSPAATVDLPGPEFGHTYRVERYQNIGIAENGDVLAYDKQVNSYWIKCRIQCSYAGATALRDFLTSTVKFGYATFSLTPDNGVDIGNGLGGSVAVRWIPGIYEEIAYAPSRYEIAMEFRREAT